jgi:hypothetical protein
MHRWNDARPGTAVAIGARVMVANEGGAARRVLEE